MAEVRLAPEAAKVVRNSRKVLQRLLSELVSKKQLSKDDLNTVLGITIQKVVEEIQAEAITIFVTEGEGIRFANVYYPPYLYEGNEKLKQVYEERGQKLKSLTLQKGQGIVGRVIATGKSDFTPDATADTRHLSTIDKETGFATKSLITVPMLVDGKAIGAIQALNKHRTTGSEQFTDQDCLLLQEVADYSAKILHKVNNPQLKLTDKEMATYLAKLMGYEFLELKGDALAAIDVNVLRLVGEELLRRHFILPLKKITSKSIKAAIANPVDFQSIDAFKWATKLNLDEIVVSPLSDIKAVIDKHFQGGTTTSKVAALVEDRYKTAVERVDVDESVGEDSAPIIQLTNRIIEDAYSRGASDIHIEPFEHDVLVRYRVDGILHEVMRLPATAIQALTSRYKIMSKLDIAERRLPQDGRIKFKEFTKTGIDIDLRVATGPMVFGEKIVMRILDKTSTAVALEQMGYSEPNLRVYKSNIIKPYGMILHVGPTGSGKTTSLYAALNAINEPTVNIQTAEDPVEYMLRGINQMQMKREIGLTFSSALRCYLRQDPDVILVGEIRDLETAEIAVEAAMTGHLLFSTLHTNDAAGTVSRLVEMGIEPYLVSSCLLMVIAQRLLRKLCKCKEKTTPTPEEMKLLAVDDPNVTIYKPGTCEICNGSGYKGRIGTHEILTLNDEVKGLIVEKATASEINKAAIENGMISIFRDAMNKVLAGITSLDEVLRVVRD